jgi:hypothetical protein
LVLGSLGVLAVPTAAGAAISSVAMSGSVNPDPAFAISTPVSLTFTYDATYTGGSNPVPMQTTFHFDNDISFDTTGIAQCPLASIHNATRAAALAACPAALVGSGSAQYSSASSITGVIDVFNGEPSSGRPTIYVHTSLNGDAVDFTPTGVLVPSSRGGDFGTMADITGWPNTPGVALSHLSVTLNNLEPTPGHHYWSALCGDPDRTFNYAGDFTYYDTSTMAATATQPCGATGLRAAALKKCKKKHSKAKRRKCRKRARRLPV